MFQGCACGLVWNMNHNETSITRILNSILFINFEFLTVTMSLLLGYVKKHTAECYDEGLVPRKPMILILFGLMCMGLVAIAVIISNLKSNGNNSTSYNN